MRALDGARWADFLALRRAGRVVPRAGVAEIIFVERVRVRALTRR
ncbi:MAG TPA: hypothetical protein VLC09_07580 [Polyangiaceae bacterium]|nr:hypothetical protein [Polyangiaceae bacterium]